MTNQPEPMESQLARQIERANAFLVAREAAQVSSLPMTPQRLVAIVQPKEFERITLTASLN